MNSASPACCQPLSTLPPNAACRKNITGLKIMAKICTPEAVVNIGELLDEADGVVFARGTLGLELPAEKVFLAQKSCLRSANLAGKVCRRGRRCWLHTTNVDPAKHEYKSIRGNKDCITSAGQAAAARVHCIAVCLTSGGGCLRSLSGLCGTSPLTDQVNVQDFFDRRRLPP
jgi:pyruvate kinase